MFVEWDCDKGKTNGHCRVGVRLASDRGVGVGGVGGINLCTQCSGKTDDAQEKGDGESGVIAVSTRLGTCQYSIPTAVGTHCQGLAFVLSDVLIYLLHV